MRYFNVSGATFNVDFNITNFIQVLCILSKFKKCIFMHFFVYLYIFKICNFSVNFTLYKLYKKHIYKKIKEFMQKICMQFLG